jgi:hypothetical protein
LRRHHKDRPALCSAFTEAGNVSNVSSLFSKLIQRRRAAALPFASLLLILLTANISSAIPLAEYRERVRRAATALETLAQQDEDEDERAYAARRAATLGNVHKAVPASVVVEWNGTQTKVDNAWLDEALRDYERGGASDTESTDALARIIERLRALEERLGEIAGEKQAASSRKDEDKRRLAAILQRDEYSRTASGQSAFSRLLERFLKWLKDLFPESKPLQPGAVRPVSTVAQIIVIALAVAVIAFVIWKLGPRLLRRGRGSKRGGKREARVVLGEHLSEDQTASDLLAEAEALARAGNLRAAIRKGYIALLCELGERKIIRLAQSKTNRDYLRAVADHNELHREMQLLTAAFENHWYGFQTPTADDWTAFRTRYHEALRQ